MECGYIASEVLHDALIKEDYSPAALEPYQQRLNASFVVKDMYKNRYFRFAFMENPRLLGNICPL